MEALPAWLKYLLDLSPALAIACAAIYAFYTGKIVPVSLVDVVERSEQSNRMLAESFRDLAESFGRLCAIMERVVPDSPVAGMLEQNGAAITAKLTAHNDKLKEASND